MAATIKEPFYNHTDRLIHKWDSYFNIYEKYFSKYREQSVNILEIGISHGGSLQLWKKYFGDNVNIFAIDINPECKKFEEDNVKIFIGSQSDEKFLQEVFSQLPDMDIILDDGGHTMIQQIVSFESLFLKVKEGGIYMVEDTNTSYWHEYHGGLKKRDSFIEYSKNLIDSLYDGHLGKHEKVRRDTITENITGISFYDSIVVFEKKKREAPFHIKIGKETIAPFVQKDLKKKTLWMKLKQKLFAITNNSYSENYKGHREN